MPSVIFDASSLVGALLKAGSVPERALLLARTHDTICLSDDIERELREVFARPKFRKYLTLGRTEFILDLISSGALRLQPTAVITECRDAKDRKYLALNRCDESTCSG